MNRVLYTGAFRFPDGDAAALRVFAVGKLFEGVGCAVSFAGWESRDQNYYEYKGHECYSQAEFRETPKGAFARLAGFLFRGTRTVKWLTRNRRFDVIVVYNPPALFAAVVLVLCKWWKLRPILDTTEWYDGGHLPGGRFGLAALENWVRMRVVYPRFRHVICVSKLLEDYFAGRNVIRIPALMDGSPPVSSRVSPTSGVFFLYAGQPGRKDRLVSFIRVLPRIQEALGRPVVLHVAGLDDRELQQLLLSDGMDLAAYRTLIECHGRVARERVSELYRQSHFSILFREDKRYAHAGFPTKAVESWSHGCPVILNPVGDVGKLARHMVDAIVVDEDRLEVQLVPALQASSDPDRYSMMFAKSREKAGRLFSLEAYQLAFTRFAERLGIRLERHG